MSVMADSYSPGDIDYPRPRLADLLLRAAKTFEHAGVYAVSGERSQDVAFLSYPMLLTEAQHILGGLQACAPTPESRCALLLERPRDFIPAFWACVLGGFVPCPLAPIRNDRERWERHLAHVDTLLGRPLFISSGRLMRELPASLASADLDALRTGLPQVRVHQAKLEGAAILMLTSGSTGNSKAVELTNGNLLASMEGRAERQELTSADVTFNWIAFDHVAALLESHMIALYVGATQLHAEPAAILTDPLQFLRLIHRHRVSIAFAPNFLLGQINALLQSARPEVIEGRVDELDLSCLRRIVTGGEANVVETGRRFLELLAPYGFPRHALWPAFGMTETCAASVYSDDFPNRDTGREFASVGLPIKGLEMRIVDEHGISLPYGDSGELQLRGQVVFRRYHNNEEATRTAFSTDGWFRTGDLGCIEDSRLTLIARSKDNVIVSGVNYYCNELESKFEQLDGIERSFVAAFPTRPTGADTEQLVVAFATTLQSNNEDGLYQLVVAVRNTTIMLWGFRPAVILPLPKSAFPKTSLGKIQRSLMRKRFEAGEFEADVIHVARVTSQHTGAHTASESPLETDVAKVFSEILRVELSDLSTSGSFFDLGGTSLDILRLARAIQTRFGLSATLPLVLQNPTVRSLAARINSRDEHQIGSYEPIIPLQLTGNKTPLFCVHPGNGEVFALVNVAKYFLNDRPFYALRPPGFNEGEECFKTVTEMVSTYVGAILRRQPRGPYVIAGYSFGCPIAFEIAKELEARGNHVAFLGSIDFRPCYEGTPLSFNMATGLALVLDLITISRYADLNRELRPDLPTDDVCDYVLTFASPERLTELDLDLRKFSVWARVAHSMETMLFAHKTSGTVRAMTVFCSEGFSSRYSIVERPRPVWRKELKHWDDFVVQPRYVDVPGHHHALMGPKHVVTFQAKLRAEIERALGEH
jgi:acyl-CoA synthetase (AMP-forming)/AMP-acid ligase II/thioesterase domain-containing protein/acyl carrier protein